MRTTQDQVTIVQDGDPVLRGKAKAVPPVEIGSKKINDILKNMQSALQKEDDGVAIAAPQIGVPLRIFLVGRNAFVLADKEKKKVAVKKPEEEPQHEDLVCINPEIVKLSKKKKKMSEGCLSVRWKYGNTMRHEKAMIRALDAHGKRFTYGGSGLIAQIFQHETDHLNGILFIDHANDIEELTPEQIQELQKKK